MTHPCGPRRTVTEPRSVRHGAAPNPLRLPGRQLLATLIAGALGAGLQQQAQAGQSSVPQHDVDFDAAILQARGIDPATAAYFKQAPRFAPGSHAVTLSVNGNPRGTVNANFDANGKLCLSAALLRQAELVVPHTPPPRATDKQPANTAAADAICYDYPRYFPQTAIDLHPGEDAIALLVPSAALARPDTDEDAGHYAQGGRAALLNYDVLATTSHDGGRSNQYKQADTEIGFNSNDWIVRSRQIVSRQEGKSSWSHPYAYAQHTFVKQKTVLQGGRISVLNTPFAIGLIEGVQLFPETALANAAGPAFLIQGAAQTRARVEVRQLGAMLFSTLVPAGPFSLAAPALISGSADLQVTVFESNGAQHGFVVPAAAYNAGRVLGAAQGPSIAVGRLNNQGYGGAAPTPWLITASDGWRPGSRTKLTSGVLLAAPYQALAGGVEYAPTATVSTTATVIAAHARGGHQGAMVSLSVNAGLAWGWNINGTITRQTAGYRDLNQITLKPDQMTPTPTPIDPAPIDQPWSPQQQAAQQQDPDRAWLMSQVKNQYTFNASWHGERVGSFSLNASRTQSFYGNSSSSVGAAWSRSFRRANVSLTVQRSLGRDAAYGNMAYLRIQLPLGRSSLETYATQTHRAMRMGASFNDTVNTMLSYNLQAERDATARSTDISSSVQLTPRYTQLDFTASWDGPGNTIFSGHARGGLFIGDGGVSFSPYPIQDTFGIVSLHGVSGARIETPAGSVWTDYRGRAVVPSLQAYASSNIQVATKSLPRNVDITNGLRVLQAGRGSVQRVAFQVVKAHRILLSTQREDGKPIPMGATVLDARQRFITSSGDDGLIFLPDDNFMQPLNVHMLSGDTCQIRYTAPPPSQAAFYSTVQAVCRAASPVSTQATQGAP